MIGFSTYLLFWLKKFNNSPCLFPGDGLGLGGVSICWEDPGLEFIVHGLSCSAHLVFCFGQQTGLVSFSCLFYSLALVYECLPSLLLVLHHGTIPPYSVLLCPTLSYSVLPHTRTILHGEARCPAQLSGATLARRMLEGREERTGQEHNRQWEVCQTVPRSNIINQNPNKEIKL